MAGIFYCYIRLKQSIKFSPQIVKISGADEAAVTDGQTIAGLDPAEISHVFYHGFLFHAAPSRY